MIIYTDGSYKYLAREKNVPCSCKKWETIKSLAAGDFTSKVFRLRKVLAEEEEESKLKYEVEKS